MNDFLTIVGFIIIGFGIGVWFMYLLVFYLNIKRNKSSKLDIFSKIKDKVCEIHSSNMTWTTGWSNLLDYINRLEKEVSNGK